ncbi:hypothetical protein JCM19037_1004 [Geomicrobium sp. JCM 19037]|nr:hypothetical protein JCM19037_1004 [Geomicrobium sp. JCM 19037]
MRGRDEHRNRRLLHATSLNNQLADVIPEERWGESVHEQLGTPSQLFAHLIRVRLVYRSALFSGKVQFPGEKVPDDAPVRSLLLSSAERLAEAFLYTEKNHITFDDRAITPVELMQIAVQHEGIHTGQYYVALKQSGYPVPTQWQTDWALT